MAKVTLLGLNLRSTNGSDAQKADFAKSMRLTRLDVLDRPKADIGETLVQRPIYNPKRTWYDSAVCQA
jgi:hypothetical protein